MQETDHIQAAMSCLEQTQIGCWNIERKDIGELSDGRVWEASDTNRLLGTSPDDAALLIFVMTQKDSLAARHQEVI